MPSRSKSLLFFTLIIVSTLLIIIKAGNIWHFFNKENFLPQTKENASFNQTVQLNDEAGKIQDSLNRQRHEIEIQTAELKALSAEIDDKLEALRQAEENILRLIEQKEDLAATLHQTPDQAYEMLHQETDGLQEENWQTETPAGETLIIELAPSDE